MPEATVESIEDVGVDTIALELATPPEFEAAPGQFILIRGLDDGEETGYYTISSPYVDESFQVTVAIGADSELGAWLAERDVGESVTVEGPFGDIQYTGDVDPFVVAEGPGMGPGIGIAERALDEARSVTLVYAESDPPHADRIERVTEAGGRTVQLQELDRLPDVLADVEDDRIYVFGYAAFVDRVRGALETADIPPGDAEIENFGPE